MPTNLPESGEPAAIPRRDDPRDALIVKGGPPLACLAERALMHTLEGGCSVPVGVETEWLGQPQDSVFRARALVVSLDGSQSVQDAIDATVRTMDEAAALRERLAASLVEADADAILKDVNTNRPPKD